MTISEEVQIAQDILKTIAENLNVEPDSYRGRGMDRPCLAFPHYDVDDIMFEIGVEMGRRCERDEMCDVNAPEIERLLRTVREDSLGMGRITYFPRIPPLED